MIIIGLLLAVFLVGGTAYLAGKAIHAAHEAGTLAATPKTGSKKTRAKATARNAPHNVRTIVAQAWADNYVAKKAHAREARAVSAGNQNSNPWPEPERPRRQRRGILHRLVFPGQPGTAGHEDPETGPQPGDRRGRRMPPQERSPQPSPAPDRSPRPSRPAETAVPHPRPRLVPDPSSNGRPAPMPSAPPSAAPTGAAADMFSAANILNGHAKGGGIHAKLRATRVYEEAYSHLSASLEEMARDMQENGQYPPMVWEPVMTAAAHAKAVSMAMGESANAIASLMNMPVGELAASPVQAPHHNELNRA